MTITAAPAVHETTVWTTDQHGADALRVTIAATPAAEAAAVAFLARTTAYVIGQPYRVHGEVEPADRIGDALAEHIWPTCVHQMSLALCMGPDHFPSAQQEREMWG